MSQLDGAIPDMFIYFGNKLIYFGSLAFINPLADTYGAGAASGPGHGLETNWTAPSLALGQGPGTQDHVRPTTCRDLVRPVQPCHP